MGRMWHPGRRGPPNDRYRVDEDGTRASHDGEVGNVGSTVMHEGYWQARPSLHIGIDIEQAGEVACRPGPE